MTKSVVIWLAGFAALIVGTLVLCFVLLSSMFAEFSNFDLISAWSRGLEFAALSLGFYAAVLLGFGLAYVGVRMMKRRHD